MTHERSEREEDTISAFWPIFKSVILYAVNDMGFGMQLVWEESKKMATAKPEG